MLIIINTLKKMSKYSWSKYNETNSKLSAKIIKFNILNKINFLEVGHYNHIRDFFCLAILFNKKKNRKTKILDFGSNLLALSNIKSKIDVKSYDFFIYDPFHSKGYNNKKPFNIKFYVNKNELKFSRFDIVNFGSSLQYLENIETLSDTINFKPVTTIIITHTPITLSKEYISRQKNHKSLIQNIHSLKGIQKYFDKFGFGLVFKSRNDEKYIACEKKQKNTHSLNLIFLKK